LEHAAAFAQTWETIRDGSEPTFLDLGSGGGLPGLLLLERWGSPGTLLDSMARRTSFLSEVLTWEGAPGNGSVILARAEDAARIPGVEGTYDLVTARSFGPPATTAECAVRLLAVGGILLVSDPPDPSAESRWSPEGLKTLGLADLGMGQATFRIRVLEKIAPTPDDFPRRNGVPRKRPLF
jgi:16S rRNA (guanine527-N7)-methyltransferase